MAKPTVYFKGVAYSVGGHSGYRPSLTTADVVKNYDVCEEVVLREGLAMSPNELLMGVQAVLGQVPAYCGEDGKDRQIDGCLKWYRSAKGNLPSATADWDATTCTAPIRAKMLTGEAGKIYLNANFANEAGAVRPKLNNVTYIGASVATNVIAQGMSFAAYGRFMQFDSALGDWAKLVKSDGTELSLVCSSSDAAHAVFAWPAGLTVEVGTKLTFKMWSRAGASSGAETLNTKKVTVVAAPAQLPKVKIVTSGASATMHMLELGVENEAGVTGYSVDEETGEVSIQIKVDGVARTASRPSGGSTFVWQGCEAEEGATLTLTIVPDPAKATTYDQTPDSTTITVGP